MIWLYNLALTLYKALATLLSPFMPKARHWVQGQRRTWAYLAQHWPLNAPGPRIWVHCASLGEFEQGRPLIEALRQQYPTARILLTFYSPSGYRVRHNYQGAHAVCYLPLDSARNARRFMATVQPNLVLFVKYEYWHHYLKQVQQQQVPLLLVSGIFRHEQPFFRTGLLGGPVRRFYQNILANFSHLFVQDAHSTQLLNTLPQAPPHTVAGDTRFDRVHAIVQNAQPNAIVKAFAGTEGAPLLVAGSTWPQDLGCLQHLLQHGPPKLRLVVAPHEVSPVSISQTCQALGQAQCVLYSQASQRWAQNPQNVTQTLLRHRVLVVDNVGMLASLYGHGQIAYIGGAFGKGLHNVLEAATYGMPLFFGMLNYKKFKEAVDLEAIGAAHPIRLAADFTGQVYQLLQDPEALQAQSQLARTYVQQNTGATQTIMQYLQQHWQPPAANSPQA